MKKTKWILALILLGLSFGFSSCTDENDNNNDNPSTTENLPNGVFVLCEGNDGMNNSALVHYNLQNNEVIDIFDKINNQGLGDLGNDMELFGDKLFISVKGSASVNVLNSKTGKLIKRIPIVDEQGANRKPSRLTQSSSMVYLCTVDGYVVEINPQTLSLGRKVKVGRNPEDICYLNGNLYVTNSGGLDWNTSVGYDRTVSVVDAQSMTETKKIDVGLNPSFIKPIAENTIGLIVRGNYNDVPTSFSTINTTTNEVATTTNVNMSNFDVIGNNILYVNYDYISMQASIKTYNYLTNTSSDFITTSDILPQFMSPYGVNVNTAFNEVYLTDATTYSTSGKVFVFDLNGSFKYSFATSNIPSVSLRVE
jgi:hypothetical protein